MADLSILPGPISWFVSKDGAPTMAGTDYKMTGQVLENKAGLPVLVLTFETLSELERFFLDELIGNPIMRDCASKAIGLKLMIWDK